MTIEQSVTKSDYLTSADRYLQLLAIDLLLIFLLNTVLPLVSID